MKLSILLTGLTVAIVLLGTSSARATIVGTCFGPETHALGEFFDQAKYKIDIRCAFVEDSTLLKALQRAGKRGVKIRLVVDKLTPALLRIAAQSKAKILLHLLSTSQQGHYLAEHYTGTNLRHTSKNMPALTQRARQFIAEAKPEARAEVDYIQSWYGVPYWSASHWVGISTTVIHTLYPDPKAGSPRFVQAWKHSRLVIPQVPATQVTSASRNKRGTL